MVVNLSLRFINGGTHKEQEPKPEPKRAAIGTIRSEFATVQTQMVKPKTNILLDKAETAAKKGGKAAATSSKLAAAAAASDSSMVVDGFVNIGYLLQIHGGESLSWVHRWWRP
ncbi:hypothetical protein ACB098_01G114500 [Castanea mollissima]